MLGQRVSTEVQWGKFRRQLRSALRSIDPEMAELEAEKLTPSDVERETGGSVKAAVLTEYLESTRPDLPATYLPLLLALKPLELTLSDSMSTPPMQTWSKSTAIRRNHTPAQEAVRTRIKAEGPVCRPPGPVCYVSLYCDDPQAMRATLKNRIDRAGVTQVALGRQFNLTIRNRALCRELEGFMMQLGPHGRGPSFAGKLQDRFWEICEFLKCEIQKREGGPEQTTEEFVRALLKEGTVYNGPERIGDMLREVNDLYWGRKPDAPEKPR